MRLLYAGPAVFFLLFLGFTSGALKVNIPLLELRWILDRVWMLLASMPYLVGGFVLATGVPQGRRSHRAPAVEVAAQRDFCGMLPFAVLYVLPYVLGAVPNTTRRCRCCLWCWFR